MWINRFTDIAESEGWLDQSMDLKSKLIKVVDNTTYSWLGTLDRSLLNSSRWPEFKEAFLRRFGRTKADALRELMTRKQGERESVRSFGEAVCCARRHMLTATVTSQLSFSEPV